MSFNEQYKNRLLIDNGSLFFSNNERDAITELFNEQEIDIIFGNRNICNSIFNTIVIYFNHYLTNSIIEGIILPAAYDLLKNTILTIGSKISSSKIVSKKDEPVISLKMKLDDAELIAPIPNNLSDEQLQIYMNMLERAILKLPKERNKYESFFAESNKELDKVEIKTMLEYINEQRNK